MLYTHGYELATVPPNPRWHILGIILENQRRPIEEYLNQADADGFIAFVNLLLKNEPFQQMGKRLKKLRHVQNVFQITVDKDRYLGFRCVQSLILTNAFRKDAKESPPEVIQRCVNLGNLYIAQHGS